MVLRLCHWTNKISEGSNNYVLHCMVAKGTMLLLFSHDLTADKSLRINSEVYLNIYTAQIVSAK